VCSPPLPDRRHVLPLQAKRDYDRRDTVRHGHRVTVLLGVLSGLHVNAFVMDAIIGLSVVYNFGTKRSPSVRGDVFDHARSMEAILGFQIHPTTGGGGRTVGGGSSGAAACRGRGVLDVRNPRHPSYGRRGFCSGEGEIRTPATLAGRPVFETGAFNHSATSPGGFGVKRYPRARDSSNDYGASRCRGGAGRSMRPRIQWARVRR
jgi:hypothetical protein